MKPKLMLFAIVATILSGCGGGGTASESIPGGTPSESIPPQTTTRLIQHGDYWEYEISGTVVYNDNRSYALRGTVTSSAAQVSFDGETVLKITDIVELRTNSNEVSTTVEQWYRQKPDRSIVLLARRTDGGPIKRVLSTENFVPGTWQVGLSQDGETLFDNNTRETFSWTVVGSQRLSVPAGRFSAWKVLQEGYDDDIDELYKYTEFYSPEIGAYISLTGTSETPESTTTLTFRLTRYSLSP